MKNFKIREGFFEILKILKKSQNKNFKMKFLQEKIYFLSDFFSNRKSLISPFICNRSHVQRVCQVVFARDRVKKLPQMAISRVFSETASLVKENYQFIYSVYSAVTFFKLNIFWFCFFLTISTYPETFKNEVDLPKTHPWESPTPSKTKKHQILGFLIPSVVGVS